MIIGVPKEVKIHEFRVAITPAGVVELIRNGHSVCIETRAGVGSSIADADFEAAGARICAGAAEVWSEADLVLKVKEPIPSEHALMRPEQILFTYLHLAADGGLLDALLGASVTAIAYETVETSSGELPLLAPMSDIAGRLAPQVGAQALLRSSGGRGVLLGGVPGVRPAFVVVIGAGVAGVSAATVAAGMGAEVLLLDRDMSRLRAVDAIARGGIRTVASSALEIDHLVTQADLVIGAVLVPGARAPRLVTNEQVARMKSGSVLVDISIDQGGCFEDSRPTTHDDPTYTVHESTFYCVANMPGVVPHTSTFALTNSTIPFVTRIANLGWRAALAADGALAQGLNTAMGQVTHSAVAAAHGMTAIDLGEVL